MKLLSGSITQPLLQFSFFQRHWLPIAQTLFFAHLLLSHPRSSFRSLLSAMPSYTTILVLALAASNVSPAFSAPLLEVRDRSLSHRAPNVEAAVAKTSWGDTVKKYGKQFLIGTAATMAFAYAFEKLSGSGSSSSQGSSTPSTTPATPGSSVPPNTGNTANNPNNQAYSPSTGPTYSPSTGSTYSPSTGPTYSPSTGPTYSPSTGPTYSPSSGPTYSPSNYPTFSPSTGPTYSPSTSPTYSTSTNPTYSTSTGPTYYSPSTDPTSQTQNGYQQRDVNRVLPADIFEAGSTSDNNNQNRQTASLDLLGRADLVDAIRLFRRMLDELD